MTIPRHRCQLAMFNDFLLLSVLFSFQGALLLTALVLTLYITCSFFCDVRVSNLGKKAVFITGCDSGFGHELAKKLDAERLRVFAACLTSEGEAKLKNECSSELITLKLDVTNSRDIQYALQAVKSHLPSQGKCRSKDRTLVLAKTASFHVTFLRFGFLCQTTSKWKHLNR